MVVFESGRAIQWDEKLETQKVRPKQEDVEELIAKIKGSGVA
jgi:hypothetical protein